MKDSIIFIALVVLSILLPYQIVIATLSLTSARQNVFDYLLNNQPLDTGFNAREISHLYDVKLVMAWTTAIFVLSLIVAILFYRQIPARSFGAAGITILALAILLVSATFFSFDQLFHYFHSIFFIAGTWLFEPTDKLIQLFPLTFFISITKRILIGSILCGIALIIKSRSTYRS